MKTTDINRHQINNKDGVGYFRTERNCSTIPDIVRIATKEEIAEAQNRPNNHAYGLHKLGKTGFVAVVHMKQIDNTGKSPYDEDFHCDKIEPAYLSVVPLNQITCPMNDHYPVVEKINRMHAVRWSIKHAARAEAQAKIERTKQEQALGMDIAKRIRDGFGRSYQSGHVDSSGKMVVSVSLLAELLDLAEAAKALNIQPATIAS